MANFNATLGTIGGVVSSENSNNVSTTDDSGNTSSAGGLGSTSVIAGSGSNITTTDFGATKAAGDVAMAGIASVEHGYELLSGLTGQALLAATKGGVDQNQPASVTFGKYGVIIVGFLVAAYVLVRVVKSLFSRGKK